MHQRRASQSSVTSTPSIERPSQSVPMASRVSLLSLLVVLAVLVVQRLYPSPWLTHSSTLFRRPPGAFYATPESGISRPVQGCQDTSVTAALEPRERAAIVVLLRHQDLDELLPTLRNFEQRFNSQFRYPYVMLATPDEGSFGDEFRNRVAQVLPEGAVVEYALVEDRDHWKIPGWMDSDQVREGFAEQERAGVQYAGREGYHHMCRFYSGLWARQPALAKYDWYWRLEPGVRFYCDITYDPFRFMAVNNKIYGFVITIVENMNTIPSLFKMVQNYAQKRQLKPNGAIWDFLTRKNKDTGETEYNGCHFWTNFEIGDLRFFRSTAYQDLFDELDRAGGFYTERWGDAPVRALALGILSDMDRIHYFEDFAYQHDWFMHCPTKESGLGCNCDCPAYSRQALPKNELTDVDRDWRFSCLPKWREAEQGYNSGRSATR